jgi:hypothetical protein
MFRRNCVPRSHDGFREPAAARFPRQGSATVLATETFQKKGQTTGELQHLRRPTGSSPLFPGQRPSGAETACRRERMEEALPGNYEACFN